MEKEAQIRRITTEPEFISESKYLGIKIGTYLGLDGNCFCRDMERGNVIARGDVISHVWQLAKRRVRLDALRQKLQQEIYEHLEHGGEPKRNESKFRIEVEIPVDYRGSLDVGAEPLGRVG